MRQNVHFSYCLIKLTQKVQFSRLIKVSKVDIWAVLTFVSRKLCLKKGKKVSLDASRQDEYTVHVTA
jgi:hypothetical protein